MTVKTIQSRPLLASGSFIVPQDMNTFEIDAGVIQLVVKVDPTISAPVVRFVNKIEIDLPSTPPPAKGYFEIPLNSPGGKTYVVSVFEEGLMTNTGTAICITYSVVG